MESYLDEMANITVKIADLGNACWVVRGHFCAVDLVLTVNQL